VIRKSALAKHAHRNPVGLSTWAVVPASQLRNLGVKLFHMLNELTNADTLGLLEHVCGVVPLLLSHGIGEHGEKVGHHAVIK
jgi:hypothetical protein